MPALNEGRGLNPGDTGCRSAGRSSTHTLNEGRGLNPGDTHRALRLRDRHVVRSTKAGASTPATLGTFWVVAGSAMDAQRRPGPQPRRHDRHRHDTVGGSLDRSTKAGASTPATQVRALVNPDAEDHRSTKAGASTPATRHKTLVIFDGIDAQRRPGPQPRRHACGPGVVAAILQHRSTKAGASTPATPVEEVGGGLVVVARSTKAGASTPATPGASRWRRSGSTSLNEGRGLNPGDTIAVGDVFCPMFVAQRRPGPQPRRHSTSLRSGRSTSTPLNEGRGLNPGDTDRIHPVGELAQERSTKAGASTPATPPESTTRRVLLAIALNEGRGLNPGDTLSSLLRLQCSSPAQRRPGPQPRRHTHFVTTSAQSDEGSAQRRPGPQPRRHPRTFSMYTLPRLSAQRRPGPQPRRHSQGIVILTSGHWPLNEGRGLNPGDTRTFYCPEHAPRRSTKAGASTPATLLITSGHRSRGGLYSFLNVRSSTHVRNGRLFVRGPASKGKSPEVRTLHQSTQG